MIIIEGPDASGKSTLARHLAEVLSTDIFVGEGPPRYSGDIPQRLERYDQLPPSTICDRHPAVSEDIYSRAIGRPTELTQAHMDAFYQQDHLLIYCDPQVIARHITKPHDTHEHLEAVSKNRPQLVAFYRQWAIAHAHVVYRIGDDVRRIIQFTHSYTRDIADFHNKFDIAYHGEPRHLPRDLRSFRVKFLAEELCEYAGLSGTTKDLVQSVLVAATPPPLEDQFDALIDLVYVALGTAHLHGFPFQRGWSRVQAANMRKIRAPTAADSRRGHASDVIKPPGWAPPSLADLVGQDSAFVVL